MIVVLRNYDTARDIIHRIRITNGTASMMRFRNARNRKTTICAPSVSGHRSCPISACARCA